MSTEDGGRSPRCCPGRDPARPRPSRCSSSKITWSKPPTCCAGRIRPMSRRTSSRAVSNEFMDLEPSAVTSAPSASEQHSVGKFRRWGDGIGAPSGDSTTDHNRPGANPPHTYVDAVPRKSRSQRVMPARTSRADCGRLVRPQTRHATVVRCSPHKFVARWDLVALDRKHSGVRSEARVPLTAVALCVV